MQQPPSSKHWVTLTTIAWGGLAAVAPCLLGKQLILAEYVLLFFLLSSVFPVSCGHSQGEHGNMALGFFFFFFFMEVEFGEV